MSLHLRRVAIRSYRSIVKADLQLGEITVVIGPSDSGKSNVVRALRDWAYNARGLGFITEGKTLMRIAVVVGRDHKVVFEKATKGSHGTSRYVVVDAARPDEKVAYAKLGLTVPEEVTQITQIRPVEVDDVTVPIHFAEQAEAWFLLNPTAWTPNKVSKVIGRITGIDALLLAHRDLVNKRTALNREIKQVQARAEEYQVEARKFGTLDEFEAHVAKAEEVAEGLDRDRTRLKTAGVLVRKVASQRTYLKDLRGQLRATRAIVAYVEEQDLINRLATLKQATAIMSKVEKGQRALALARGKTELAKGRLQGCCDMLAAIASDDSLTCPLCGEGAHKQCRIAIAKQARAAKEAAQ